MLYSKANKEEPPVAVELFSADCGEFAAGAVLYLDRCV